jgi:hypothetical protein
VINSGASKRISLNANQINFNNSFAVSLIIDLNGIVLRADRSLSEQKPIQDFLIKYNAQVSRVNIQMDILFGVITKILKKNKY